VGFGCRLSGQASPWRTRTSKSFNGKFRDVCLNEHWFVTMAQARRVIENWRIVSLNADSTSIPY